MLTFLGYLAAFAASYVIVRYLVLPAIRKSRGASGGISAGPRPGDGGHNDLP